MFLRYNRNYLDGVEVFVEGHFTPVWCRVHNGRVYDVTHCYHLGKSAFLHIHYVPSQCLVSV